MTTTMHFGPEWMRTKSSQSLTQLNSPSSPAAPPSSASYSALLSSAPAPQTEQHDETNPFRYTKEEMLRIYRDNTSKTGLGLEVERWEGVVRETVAEPISLRAMSEAEEKVLFFFSFLGLPHVRYFSSLQVHLTQNYVADNLQIIFRLSPLKI